MIARRVLTLPRLCTTVLACFANLNRQFGELALQDTLLFLWNTGLLFLSVLYLPSLCTLQGLHLHGNTPILLLG